MSIIKTVDRSLLRFFGFAVFPVPSQGKEAGLNEIRRERKSRFERRPVGPDERSVDIPGKPWAWKAEKHSSSVRPVFPRKQEGDC